MTTKDDQKSPLPEKKVTIDVTEMQVALVKEGQNQWRVKTADGKDLLCECGRPVEASLHNVSVPKSKLRPCPMVKIVK